ncbi:MAG: TIGR01777 family oxidoreductase [Sulfurimonadaceae bacterium]|nr:TIGR01777 family oxidoreductase [Sulfurimonadaceae bacterium]
MRIAITGVSGFVGQALRRFFSDRGDEVVGLSIRNITPPDETRAKLDGCDVVINLAGANILARWSDAYKEQLYESRIVTTRHLVEALSQCDERPGVLISASAVGIYRNGVECDERGEQEDDFLAALCRDWEAEANEANRLGMRVALMRLGVVYGRGGGAMEKMLLPFKLGVGGKLGSGTQMVSWMHVTDLIRAIAYIIDHDTLYGAFNFTAPHPLSNLEQTELLAKALHRPAFMTVPEFAVKLLFGEGATVMLDSKEAYPKALLDAGFEFVYPDLGSALEEIVGR